MNKSKGITISTFFIGLAFLFLVFNLAFDIISLFKNYQFYLLLIILIDCIFLISYYLLLHNKKIGLYIMLMNIILFIVVDMLLGEGLFFFSSEFILTVFVLCGISSQIKNLE